VDKIQIIYGGDSKELDRAIKMLMDNTKSNFEICAVSMSEVSRQSLLESKIVWTKLWPKVDKELIRQLPNLSYVVSPTTALGHIDQDFLKKRGIKLFSLRDLPNVINSITSTSEFTLALILAVWRNIMPASLDTRNIEISLKRENYFSYQLKDRELGIIGFGRVGKQLAKYAQALGLNVSYYDPFLTGTTGRTFKQVKQKALIDLCKESDILAVTASVRDPLSPILKREHIFCMKKTAVLVNTSRGSLVDEHALADALEMGLLRGAGIDVLKEEDIRFQNEKSPLIDLDREKVNLLITPHLAGATHDALEKINFELLKLLLKDIHK
jgi:D-3-phosphoglycerate dehydrogenase